MAKEIVLDQAQVMGYLESSEEYPVDFEAAWQWLGYSSRSRAQEALQEHEELTLNEQYIAFNREGLIGCPSLGYKLSFMGFIVWACTSRNDLASDVVRYWVKSSRAAKTAPLVQPPIPTLEPKAKRELTKSYRRKVSSTVKWKAQKAWLDSQGYSQVDVDSIHDFTCGVYALQSPGQEIFYVGRSKGVKTRLKNTTHPFNQSFQETGRRPVIYIKPSEDYKFEECLAIGNLRPKWNFGNSPLMTEKRLKNKERKVVVGRDSLYKLIFMESVCAELKKRTWEKSNNCVMVDPFDFALNGMGLRS